MASLSAQALRYGDVRLDEDADPATVDVPSPLRSRMSRSGDLCRRGECCSRSMSVGEPARRCGERGRLPVVS